LDTSNLSRSELAGALTLWYKKAQSLTAENERLHELHLERTNFTTKVIVEKEALRDMLDEIVNKAPYKYRMETVEIYLEHEQIDQARKLVKK